MAKLKKAIRMDSKLVSKIQSQADKEKRTWSNMVNYILESWIQSKMK